MLRTVARLFHNTMNYLGSPASPFQTLKLYFHLTNLPGTVKGPYPTHPGRLFDLFTKAPSMYLTSLLSFAAFSGKSHLHKTKLIPSLIKSFHDKGLSLLSFANKLIITIIIVIGISTKRHQTLHISLPPASTNFYDSE